MEKYLITGLHDRPETYLDVIEDICSYTLQRMSLGVTSSAQGQKGSTKDGDVQAYSAHTRPVNKGNKQGRGRSRGGHSTDSAKPRSPCWNCGSTDCPRGKNCKTEKSAHCKKCKAENWHKTENHDAWLEAREKRNAKRAEQGRSSSPAAAPAPAAAPLGRAVPPAALAHPPHLNYALQPQYHTGYTLQSIPEDEPFVGMVRVVRDPYYSPQPHIDPCALALRSDKVLSSTVAAWAVICSPRLVHTHCYRNVHAPMITHCTA